MSINVQYVGFKSKAIAREYTFLVREVSTEPQEIIFSILNEAFSSRRLSFQNAPDICSLKLHREMADPVNNPMKTHYRISETDLDHYRDSHPSQAAKGLYPRKPAPHSSV
jgi:hypothetical protein